MWSIARDGKTSGVRAKKTRNLFIDVREYLNQTEYAKAAAVQLLAEEKFAVGTTDRNTLRAKVDSIMFPVPVFMTEAMRKGIEAEKKVLSDPKIRKEVVELLKAKYQTSTKFNKKGEAAPPFIGDSDILLGNLPLSFHTKYPNTMVASLDFIFNKDCNVQMKHGINFDLANLPAVSKGKLV